MPQVVKVNALQADGGKTRQPDALTKVYLHSSRERQRALADAVGEAARAELGKPKRTKKASPEGTPRARNRRPAAGGGV
jgi:hypothetical protein